MPGDRFLELAIAQDRHLFDVLFGDAREAVTVQDKTGQLLYANDRAASLVGAPDGEAMASEPGSWLSGLEMVDEHGDPLPPESLPGRRVLAGEDPPEVTVGYRKGGSRSIRWSRVNASPVKNDAGEVVWAINFFLDVTEQIRQKERERILSEVTEALTGALSTKPSLKALADVIVPDLASWCGFHLLDEFEYLQPLGFSFPETPDALALFELVDSHRIDPDSDQLQARVLTSGQAKHIPKVTAEMLEALEATSGKKLTDVVRRLDLGSVLCLPLGVGAAAVGTLTLMRGSDEKPFAGVEIALLRDIAERAGVALANARLFEREHHTAEALRRGLTPAFIPEIPGMEFAARYRPLARIGHVGGDFYDVLALDEDRFALLIGDVEGKGVEAAATVGVARQTLKTTISLMPEPEVVVRQLNSSLQSETHPRMCTLAYILLKRNEDHFDGTVTLAGHPPPILLKADETMTQLGDPCPPAGLLPGIDPKPVSFELFPGDTLVAYTDGFSTRDRPSPATVEDHLRSGGGIDTPRLLLEQMLDGFDKEVGTPHDDIALIVARATQPTTP